MSIEFLLRRCIARRGQLLLRIEQLLGIGHVELEVVIGFQTVSLIIAIILHPTDHITCPFGNLRCFHLPFQVWCKIVLLFTALPQYIDFWINFILWIFFGRFRPCQHQRLVLLSLLFQILFLNLKFKVDLNGLPPLHILLD